MSLFRYEKYQVTPTWGNEVISSTDIIYIRDIQSQWRSGYLYSAASGYSLSGTSPSSLSSTAYYYSDVNNTSLKRSVIRYQHTGNRSNDGTYISYSYYKVELYRNKTGDTQTYIQSITAEDGEYPDNGYKDGYLYIKKEAVIQNKYLVQDGEQIKKFVAPSAGGKVPIMTSNTAPSGVASASDIYSYNYDAWKAFNGDEVTPNDYWQGRLPGWLAYEFTSKQLVNEYSIAARSNDLTQAPKKWTFEGWNDVALAWEILDTQANITDWSSDPKVFEINNLTAYKKFRLNITGTNGSGYVSVAELKLTHKEQEGWKVVGSVPVTKAMFDADGMTDLSIITNEAIQQLISEEPELLCWTDEEIKQDIIAYTDDITPPMTQYNKPSPCEVRISSDWWGSDISNQTAYQAFDHQDTSHLYNSWLSANASMPQWIEFDFGKDYKKTVQKYTVMGPFKSNDSGSVNSAPKNWILQGSNDGSNYDDLHTVSNQSNWEYATSRTFTFSNNKSYQIYRLCITANNGNTSHVCVGEIELMEAILSEPLHPSRIVHLTAVPLPQLLLAKEDIEVAELENISIDAVVHQSDNDLKIALSGDSGENWAGKAAVNINDLSNFKTNGLSVSEFNALSKEQLKSLCPNGKIRMAFYLEQENTTNAVEIRSVTINERLYTMTPEVESLSVLYSLLEAESPDLYVSRDDGVTWKKIKRDELADLSALPEGNQLRVKVVLSNGQELQALSYSWI